MMPHSVLVIFACLYAVTCVASIVMFVKFKYPSKIFCVTYFLAMILRGTFYFLRAFNAQLNQQWWFVFDVLPVFCRYIALVSVTLFWAEIYMKQTYNKDVSRKLNYVYVLLVVITLVGGIIVFTVNVAVGYHDVDLLTRFKRDSIIFLLCFYLTVTFGIPIALLTYGYSVYKRTFFLLMLMPLEVSKEDLRLRRKIGLITLICTLTWSINLVFALQKQLLNQKTGLIFFFEVLVLFTAIILLGSFTGRRTSLWKNERAPILEEYNRINVNSKISEI